MYILLILNSEKNVENRLIRLKLWTENTDIQAKWNAGQSK